MFQVYIHQDPGMSALRTPCRGTLTYWRPGVSTRTSTLPMPSPWSLEPFKLYTQTTPLTTTTQTSIATLPRRPQTLASNSPLSSALTTKLPLYPLLTLSDTLFRLSSRRSQNSQQNRGWPSLSLSRSSSDNRQQRWKTTTTMITDIYREQVLRGQRGWRRGAQHNGERRRVTGGGGVSGGGSKSDSRRWRQ